MSTDSQFTTPATVWFGLKGHHEVRAGLGIWSNGSVRFCSDSTEGALLRPETESFARLVSDLALLVRGDYLVSIETPPIQENGVEVTPAVLRAVAGFISDSGVVSDVVRILKHLAIDLEVQQKAGLR